MIVTARIVMEKKPSRVTVQRIQNSNLYGRKDTVRSTIVALMPFILAPPLIIIIVVVDSQQQGYR
jgi:hypothetical protein